MRGSVFHRVAALIVATGLLICIAFYLLVSPAVWRDVQNVSLTAFTKRLSSQPVSFPSQEDRESGDEKHLVESPLFGDISIAQIGQDILTDVAESDLVRFLNMEALENSTITSTILPEEVAETSRVISTAETTDCPTQLVTSQISASSENPAILQPERVEMLLEDDSSFGLGNSSVGHEIAMLIISGKETYFDRSFIAPLMLSDPHLREIDDVFPYNPINMTAWYLLDSLSATDSVEADILMRLKVNKGNPRVLPLRVDEARPGRRCIDGLFEALKRQPTADWYIVMDDDTVLFAHNVVRILDAYHNPRENPVALGTLSERRKPPEKWYTYGGAGIAVSYAAAIQVAKYFGFDPANLKKRYPYFEGGDETLFHGLRMAGVKVDFWQRFHQMDAHWGGPVGMAAWIENVAGRHPIASLHHLNWFAGGLYPSAGASQAGQHRHLFHAYFNHRPEQFGLKVTGGNEIIQIIVTLGFRMSLLAALPHSTDSCTLTYEGLRPDSRCWQYRAAGYRAQVAKESHCSTANRVSLCSSHSAYRWSIREHAHEKKHLVVTVPSMELERDTEKPEVDAHVLVPILFPTLPPVAAEEGGSEVSAAAQVEAGVLSASRQVWVRGHGQMFRAHSKFYATASSHGMLLLLKDTMRSQVAGGVVHAASFAASLLRVIQLAVNTEWIVFPSSDMAVTSANGSIHAATLEIPPILEVLSWSISRDYQALTDPYFESVKGKGLREEVVVLCGSTLAISRLLAESILESGLCRDARSAIECVSRMSSHPEVNSSRGDTDESSVGADDHDDRFGGRMVDNSGTSLRSSLGGDSDEDPQKRKKRPHKTVRELLQEQVPSDQPPRYAVVEVPPAVLSPSGRLLDLPERSKEDVCEHDPWIWIDRPEYCPGTPRRMADGQYHPPEEDGQEYVDLKYRHRFPDVTSVVP